jgi:hypothetical protein
MRAIAAALLLAGAPAFAFAQQPPPPAPTPTATPVLLDRPVSGFVVDARASLVKFGQRPATAVALQTSPANLPGPGLGGTIGAHVYPLHVGRVVIGFGGELMLARRSRQPLDIAGEPLGANLQARAMSMSPQVSLNFGRRKGWSFVSGGIGTGSFETWAGTGEMPDRKVRVINYGGGARWFSSAHLAFTIDLRFYAMSPGLETATAPERARQRLMVLSVGVSGR